MQLKNHYSNHKANDIVKHKECRRHAKFCLTISLSLSLESVGERWTDFRTLSHTGMNDNQEYQMSELETVGLFSELYIVGNHFSLDL